MAAKADYRALGMRFAIGQPFVCCAARQTKIAFSADPAADALPPIGMRSIVVGVVADSITHRDKRARKSPGRLSSKSGPARQA